MGFLRWLRSLFGGRSSATESDSRGVVIIARAVATSAYVDFAQSHPVLGDTDLDTWDFFATVACVYAAIAHLDVHSSGDAFESGARGAMTDLEEWSGDGVRAYLDCKAFVERAMEGASECERGVYPAALGSWVVWNLFGRAPTSDDVALVAEIGALAANFGASVWQ